MQPQDSGQVVRFGAFELDLRAGELRRGKIRLPLQGRPIQTLAILVRNPGQLVTREQLRQELWSADTFVDFEHGLHNAVARIRAVLGDSPETPRFIETLPRRGYRFIATVQPVPAGISTPEPARHESGTENQPQSLAASLEPVPSPPSRTRRLLPAAMAVLVIAAALLARRALPVGGRPVIERMDSLAVLPLQNLSADPEQEYFADGVTEAMITELAHIKALRVVSRTSIARYKGTRKTAPEIARELGVQAILEGAVARAG